MIATFKAGLLASGSSYWPHLPANRRLRCFRKAETSSSQWFTRRSSPVTAAGPRRIRTVFPILPGKTQQAAGTPCVRMENLPRAAPTSMARQSGFSGTARKCREHESLRVRDAVPNLKTDTRVRDASQKRLPNFQPALTHQFPATKR